MACRVTELVLRWAERREQGQSASPEGLCAGFPELLPQVRRRVQALEALEALRQGLDTHPSGDGATTTAPAERAAGDDGSAPVVPGYEVRGVLGQGGMGVVYQARQVKAKRLVALKMIPAGPHAAADQLARFQAEAEAAALAAPQHRAGLRGRRARRPALLLPGVRRGRQPGQEAGAHAPAAARGRRPGGALARAVHVAHQAGIAHRDLNLTGRPPFRGASVLETLDVVRNAEPVPPSRLTPNLPRDLETICLKCLQKEPRKRYASALELAEDLHRFLADEPILARPAGRAERAWKWAKRRPAVASLPALVVLVAVTLSGFRGRQYRMTVQAEREASSKADALDKAAKEIAAKATEAANRADEAKREAKAARLAEEEERIAGYTAAMQRVQGRWRAGDVPGALEPLEGGVATAGRAPDAPSSAASTRSRRAASASFSICRTRSRVSPSRTPTSCSVSGSSPPRP